MSKEFCSSIIFRRKLLRENITQDKLEKNRKKTNFCEEKSHVSSRQRKSVAHKSVLAMGQLRDLKYELLEHPLDLVPSNFYLFSKLKIFLARK